MNKRDTEITLRLETPYYVRSSQSDFAERQYQQFRKDRRSMRKLRSRLSHVGGLLAVNLAAAAVLLTLVAAVFNQTPWGLIGGLL